MPCQSTSNVFWLDRELIDATLKHLLKTYTGDDDVRVRVLRDIINEGWDLFLRVLDDGFIIPSSLAVSNLAYPFKNKLTDPPRTSIEGLQLSCNNILSDASLTKAFIQKWIFQHISTSFQMPLIQQNSPSSPRQTHCVRTPYLLLNFSVLLLLHLPCRPNCQSSLIPRDRELVPA